MSKKRRKRHEEQKREKRPAPTSNAVSRMADFIPAGLAEKLRQLLPKAVTAKPTSTPPAPKNESSERPSTRRANTF